MDIFSDYGAKDSFEENERILERILPNERQFLGANTPPGTVLLSLSQVYWDHAKFDQAQGRSQDARKNFEKADALIARNVNVLRPVNPQQAMVQISRQAEVRASLGRYDEAEALFAEVLVYLRGNWNQSRNLLSTLSELGWIRILRGSYSAAERDLREACGHLEVGSEPRYNCDGLLGASLVGQKEYADAESHLLSAYAGLVAVEKDDRLRNGTYHRLVTARFFAPDVATWVVRMYEEWGKPEEAAKWNIKLQADKTIAALSH